MVRVTPPDRDRGQLILVGCLTLALTIIAIGLVINTTLYTQSASPALSNVQIDDASTFHLETRHGTRSLVHRINHGAWNRNEGTLDTQLTQAVANYSGLMAVSYAQSEPAVVNVSYNHADSQIGTRVIQRGPAGAFDDSVENDVAADQRFGWFAMNVNVSRTSNQDTPPFTMTVSEDGGSDSITWRIYRNTTGEATNLTVETELDNGSTFTRTSHCDPVRNRVLIDGYTGELVADQCWPADRPVFGIESVSPPHEITEIEREDKYGGKWEFVTNRTNGVSGIPDCTATSPAPATNEACATPVVWTANVTANYEGPSATFVRDRNVTIYGDDE